MPTVQGHFRTSARLNAESTLIDHSMNDSFFFSPPPPPPPPSHPEGHQRAKHKSSDHVTDVVLWLKRVGEEKNKLKEGVA